ncbi:MAG: hypothetical protein J5I98_18595 [Phaeodactylibacter sp.]|nr:hypothetical protein [Phaeodactylibacter sp.]
MAGVKGRSGGRRPNSGRKGKAEEQELIERLSPMDDIAHKKLEIALKKGEAWAIKMFFEYRYGKPVQKSETNLSGQIQVTPISFFTDDEEE